MPRRVTQFSHNDLDGFGASAVAAAACEVARVAHIMRYSDVAEVMGAELDRLARAEVAETVLVTDIGVEVPFAGAIRTFVHVNSKRADPHRLVVLDHHASSLTVLRNTGFVEHGAPEGLPASAVAFTAPEERAARSDAGRAHAVVVVDVERSATRMAHEMAHLYARGASDREGLAERAVANLVACVDAVDLWRPDDPAFAHGNVLNDAFWEVVNTVAPADHPLQEAFVRGLLLNLAEAVDTMSPGSLELSLGKRRATVLGRVLREAGHVEDDEDRDGLTLRTRMSRYLARTDDLLVEAMPGVRVCHAMDVGVFQRVSDAMLRAGRARVAVDVMRGGSMSIRSRDGGSALAFARLFGGGGHGDAAGARLTKSDSVLTLEDAVARVRAVVERTGADVAREPSA